MAIGFHRDGPWEVPEGWVWARLGSVSRFIGRGRGPSYVSTGGVPVINQKCVRWRRLDVQHLKHTARTAFDSLQEHLKLRRGDVLWNSTGSGTIGRALVYDGSLPEATADSHITIVRPNEVDPGYVCYFIETMRVQHLVVAGNVGSTNQLELPRAFVQDLMIPVPPLAEQRRIVARIDELFTEIADGETALTRARHDLDTWRRALLKAAVTGELTREWRQRNDSNETGADLIAQIRKNRACRAVSKSKERDDGESEGDTSKLPNLPAKWEWSTLPELCSRDQRNGISIKGSPEPPGVMALRLDALTANGLDLRATRYIPLSAERVAAYMINEHDFLVSRANGSERLVGRAVYVGDVTGEVVFPDTMIRYPLFPSPTVGQWIQLAWNSPLTRQQIARMAKTTAGILKISQDDIAQIFVPIPPLKEMRAIIGAFRANEDRVGDGGQSAISFDRDVISLRQSILKLAFEGRLVQQDPNDEPAESLLSRLNDRPVSSPPPRRNRQRAEVQIR